MTHTRLIDVRETSEFRAGYIEGSELVPLRTVANTSAQWNRGDEITLICRSGHRAEVAKKQLQARGFTSVHVLRGGIEQWRSDGKPLVLPDGVAVTPSRLPAVLTGVAIVALLLLARSVSPWFLLPVGFLAMRLARAWWPGAMPCCAVPPQHNHSQK